MSITGREPREQRYLLVVDTESVSLCVWIREEPCLENRIGTRLKTFDDVAWSEGRLLNFCKEVGTSNTRVSTQPVNRTRYLTDSV